MIEDDLLRRVCAGVYVPVQTLPPERAVSVMHLSGGLVKVEIGDECLELRPLGSPLMGDAMHFSNTQAGMLASEVQKSMRDLVHRLLKDQIIALGLAAEYQIADPVWAGLDRASGRL